MKSNLAMRAAAGLVAVIVLTYVGWSIAQDKTESGQSQSEFQKAGGGFTSASSDSSDTTASPEGPTSQPATNDPVVHTFTLKHAVAEKQALGLQKIYPHLHFSWDSEKNALILAHASPQAAERVKKFLAFSDLSEAEKADLQKKEGVPGHVRELLEGKAAELLPATRPVIADDASPMAKRVARARQGSREAENDLLQLPADLRKKFAEGKLSNNDRQKLKEAVRRAFDARQEQLREEIAEFHQRLDRLNRVLLDRDRLKEAIIELRVEELLNPDLASSGGDKPGASPKPSVSPPPTAPQGNTFNKVTEPREPQQTNVIRLKHAKPEALGFTLERLADKDTFMLRWSPEPTTNSLLIVATSDDMAKIVDLIRILDVPPSTAATTDPGTLPANDPQPKPQPPKGAQVGLEFLSKYQQLNRLSLDMTEQQFKVFFLDDALKLDVKFHEEQGKSVYYISLHDGHQAVVMFDKDGHCAGIQRIRSSEATSKPALTLNGQATAGKSLEVYRLAHVPVQQLLNTLKKLEEDHVAAIQSSVDDKTNSLIVLAAPFEHKLVKSLVESLDVAPAGATKPPAKPEPASKSSQPETELEGVWNLVQPEGPPKPEQQVRLVFLGNLSAIFHGDHLAFVHQMELDTKKSPKQIALTGSQPGRGIYEIQESKITGLRLSLAPPEQAFPTEFGTDRPEFVRVSREVPQDLRVRILKEQPKLKPAVKQSSQADIPKDLAAWQGRWRMVRADYNGKPITEDDEARGLRSLIVSGNSLRLTGPLPDKLKEKEGWTDDFFAGDLSVDQSQKVHRFQFKMKGVMFLNPLVPLRGLYEFQDGKLVLCFVPSAFHPEGPDTKGGPLYPEVLAAPADSNDYLYVLERDPPNPDKPQPADQDPKTQVPTSSSK